MKISTDVSSQGISDTGSLSDAYYGFTSNMVKRDDKPKYVQPGTTQAGPNLMTGGELFYIAVVGYGGSAAFPTTQRPSIGDDYFLAHYPINTWIANPNAGETPLGPSKGTQSVTNQIAKIIDGNRQLWKVNKVAILSPDLNRLNWKPGWNKMEQTGKQFLFTKSVYTSLRDTLDPIGIKEVYLVNVDPGAMSTINEGNGGTTLVSNTGITVQRRMVKRRKVIVESEEIVVPTTGHLLRFSQNAQAEQNPEAAQNPQIKPDPDPDAQVKTDPVKTDPVKTEPDAQVKTEPNAQVKTEPNAQVKTEPQDSEDEEEQQQPVKKKQKTQQ